MNCTNCGSSITSGGKFCENCGMAATVQPEPAKVEAKAAEPTPAAAQPKAEKPAKPPVPKKMIPKWFIITAMVLSVLTAIGIAGLYIPQVKALFDPLPYALIFIGATVGPATLFYLFMLIFFLAKNYGHGSKLIPVLHLILYAIGGAAVGILSASLFKSQIAMALLGLASGVSFVMLCLGLYFLLREKPAE